MSKPETYKSTLQNHLARYKRRRLGISADGLWRKNQKSYAHILPEELRKLNIIEGIRAEFWEYRQKTKIKLHDDFHHLNSSQAMCFNLMFPLLNSDEGTKSLQRLLGFGRGEVQAVEFEKVADRKEGTSFDCVVNLQSGRTIYTEIKLSESDFGTTIGDERHLLKLRDTYSERLRGKVVDVALTPPIFFRNYQLLRNISFIDAQRNDLLVLLFPQANRALERGERFVKDHLTPDLIKHVKFIYLEKAIEELLRARSPRLVAYYSAFAEKYLPPSSQL